MDTTNLSWQNDRRRAEFSRRPGMMALVVDRLQHIEVDGEGRLLRAVLGPSTWRRSYADRYVEIRSEAVDGERFHIPYVAGPHEALSFMLRVRGLVLDARTAATVQADPEVVGDLDRILAWEADLLSDDGARFRKIYPRLGPLPPDQQTAIVLQPRDDFDAHVREVLKFLGKARPMRRGVYLDGIGDLAAQLGVVAAAIENAGAVAAAVPSLEMDWDSLHAAGLERVYASVDSCDEAALRALQHAHVGASLMAPAPGDEAEAEALAEQVNALPLSGADSFYTTEPQPYPYDQGRRLALRRAFHHFRARLRFPDNPAGPVVTHYPMLQSVY